MDFLPRLQLRWIDIGVCLNDRADCHVVCSGNFEEGVSPGHSVVLGVAFGWSRGRDRRRNLGDRLGDYVRIGGVAYYVLDFRLAQFRWIRCWQPQILRGRSFNALARRFGFFALAALEHQSGKEDGAEEDDNETGCIRAGIGS